MPKLNRTLIGNLHELPIEVLQFGGGNFLRAFVDWMFQILNEETGFNGRVAVIKPTEGGDYRELKSQDGLFTVVLEGIKEGKLVEEKKLVSVVQEVIHSYTEWPKYLKLAENGDVRFVVSNTTEAGIKFDPDDQFTDAPPKEFPAKLTLWLHHRYLYFERDVSKGCVLLPCELVENNGRALKDAVLQCADHWNLDPDFKDWIENANHFCSTLVDRIVSGYPRDRAGEIHEELGYEDGLLVAGEYYHSWVIDAPKEVQKELPFAKTDLNVQFVDDLAPYREMKVRLLNGAHTAMVPVGYLAGLRLVKEVMEDGAVSGFVESLLREEVLPTLDFPIGEKRKFVNDVLDRFRNPRIDHRLMSIALNGTSKFKSRLLPTFEDFYREGERFPNRIVFSLAALIRFYKGEIDGEKIEVKDDPKVLEFFDELWQKVGHGELTIGELVQETLSETNIWGENLNQMEGLTAMVSDYITAIETLGAKEALKKI